jgi:hypothetical protein
MNKKIVIAVLLVIVFSILLFFYINSHEDFDLVEINQDEFEMNGRRIVFKDKPENDEELVIANYFLCSITGEFNNRKFLYPNIPESDIDNSIKSYTDGLGSKYIEIKDIKLMSEMNINSEMDYGTKFVNAAIFHSGKTFSHYAAENNIEDFKIVKVKYYFEYTDKTMEGYPQYPPGETIRYFFLEGDKKGNYVIRTRTVPRGNDLSYMSEDMGIKIEFPEEWQNGHLINEMDNGIEVYSRQIIKNSDFEGMLFKIIRIVGELITEEDMSRNPTPSKILGHGNGYTYVLRKPTDMQYPPEDEELAKNFQLFQSYIDEITDSFEIIETASPVPEDIGFKVVGSSFFTIEIPKEWNIETVVDSYMTWLIRKEGKMIGEIKFVPYFTDNYYWFEERIHYKADNKQLLRKASINMKRDFKDIENFKKVSESMKIIDGPINVVDMFTISQQYLAGGCTHVLGSIERIEYKDDKPVKIFIDEKNYLTGDYPNGVALEDVSQFPLEYKIEHCRVLPLAPPNYVTHGKYLMPLIENFEMISPYDSLIYEFIINSEDEVLMMIGRYFP